MTQRRSGPGFSVQRDPAGYWVGLAWDGVGQVRLVQLYATRIEAQRAAIDAIERMTEARATA